VFDCSPLEIAIELIGIPWVLLELEASGAVGPIVVRLCEVAPDGRSRRLSWSARNLALSDDFSAQRSPQSGAASIEIPLFGLADTIDRGSRLRLAISTSYWPMLWPTAKSGPVTLDAGRCRVLLPVRARRTDDGTAMGEPEAAPSHTWTALRPGGYRRAEATDTATGEHALTIIEDMGTGRIEEIGLTVSESTTRTFRIRPNDPASAVLETQMTCRFARGDWSAETSARGRIAASDTGMLAQHALQATEGDRRIHARDWREDLSHPGATGARR
jgi:uncharacterized protein